MVKTMATSVANKTLSNNRDNTLDSNMTTIGNNHYLFELNIHFVMLLNVCLTNISRIIQVPVYVNQFMIHFFDCHLAKSDEL